MPIGGCRGFFFKGSIWEGGIYAMPTVSPGWIEYVLQHVKAGEIIVLIILGILIMIFFRYGVPAVEKELDEKLDKKANDHENWPDIINKKMDKTEWALACPQLREICGDKITERIDRVVERFDIKVEAIENKLEVQTAHFDKQLSDVKNSLWIAAKEISTLMSEVKTLNENFMHFLTKNGYKEKG